MQIWTNIMQGERKLEEAPGPISPNTAGPIWLFLMWIQWNNKLLDPFSFYWLGLSKLLILHQGRIASQFFIMSEKLLSSLNLLQSSCMESPEIICRLSQKSQ